MEYYTLRSSQYLTFFSDFWLVAVQVGSEGFNGALQSKNLHY
jgi:hypothetical protein